MYLIKLSWFREDLLHFISLGEWVPGKTSHIFHQHHAQKEGRCWRREASRESSGRSHDPGQRGAQSCPGQTQREVEKRQRELRFNSPQTAVLRDTWRKLRGTQMVFLQSLQDRAKTSQKAFLCVLLIGKALSDFLHYVVKVQSSVFEHCFKINLRIFFLMPFCIVKDKPTSLPQLTSSYGLFSFEKCF